MYRGINGALIGSFLWMLGTQAIDAEWYTVPSGGQVTFTLTELWAIGKGTPSSSYIEGEATIVLEYLDGSTEQIVFQHSGMAFSGKLADDGNGWYAFVTYGELFGTSVWTQTASLIAGREF